MQEMSQYGNAGSGIVGEKNVAAGGLRNLRDDLWRKVYDFRQKQNRSAIRGDARDRKMMMFSAMLSGGASLLPGLIPGPKPPPIQGNNMYADNEIRRTLGI